MKTMMSRVLPFVLLAVAVLAGAGTWAGAGSGKDPAGEPEGKEHVAQAIFAGGCFWCMEPPFDALDGVLSTTSGYTGGHVKSPTYEQVSGGRTGHYEALQVTYDPRRVSYETLLYVYWRNVDPTDGEGQFCDRGPQYRAAIFYRGDQQRRLAEASKGALEASGRLPDPVVTPIVPAAKFYPAEEYHQDYYRKNPIRYKLYRAACGRDRTLKRLWGTEAGGARP